MALIFAIKKGRYYPIKIDPDMDQLDDDFLISLEKAKRYGYKFFCTDGPNDTRTKFNIYEFITFTPQPKFAAGKSIKKKSKLSQLIAASLENKITYEIKTVATSKLIKSRWDKFKSFISAINPIGWIASAIISRLVLKSQTMQFDDANSQRNLRNQTPNQRKKHFIETRANELDFKLIKLAASGTELDTIEFGTKNSFQDKTERMHIIHFVGYNMCYEEILKNLKQEAKVIREESGGQIDPIEISFNYPNVVNSRGRALTKDDAVKAGIMQVQRLLDEGVPLNNIVLHAYSLGGGIASYVAKHFSERYKETTGEELYVFHNRSFGRLTDVIASWAPKGLQTITKYTLKFLFSPFNGDWEMNAAKAFMGLKKTNKRHLMAQDDTTIKNPISMHSKLLTRFKKVSAEQGYRIDERRIMRVNSEYRKEFASSTLKRLPNPHTVPMKKLERKIDEGRVITGHGYFFKFVYKAFKRNGWLFDNDRALAMNKPDREATEALLASRELSLK